MAQGFRTGKTGRTHISGGLRGAGALALASAMTLSCITPAAAAIGDGVHSTYDEAYYATLDYYGNLTEGSVVKSYTMNGATTLTDYGTYDEVINLTDATDPVTSDGKTTFSFDKSPEHFYFEGRTAAPFNAMPWTLSVSYDLNGVTTKAEDLAGATGVVDIHINAVPNDSASDYAKNNYTLEAMAAFNQDDILSLEAQGAQVQLIGNLRVVLFAVLPGEEQHFTISVGSNDFSFGGLTFLLTPATLAQLSDIKELKDAEADIEDSYDRLNSSIDKLLNSMSNMSSSLNSTAEGLDELNQARDTISSGKDEVYDSADKALGDLDALNESLGKIPDHLDKAEKAVDDVTDSLNDVNDTVVSLKDNLDDVRDSLNDLQSDMNKIKALAGTSNSSGMRKNLTKLGTDIAALKANLTTLRPLLAELQLGVGTGSDREDVTIQGMTMAEVNEALSKAESLESLYDGVGGGSELNFVKFMVAAQMADGTSQADAAANAQKLYSVYTSFPSAAAAQAAETADPATYAGVAAAWQKASLFAAIYKASVQPAEAGGAAELSDTMNEAEFFTAMLMMSDYKADSSKLSAILGGAAAYYEKGSSLVALYGQSKTGLLANMSSLCDTLGSDGLTGDLDSLCGLTASTITDLNKLGDVGDELIDKADKLIDEADDLNDIINNYTPDLKSALTDTKSLVGTMTTTIDDTHGFLTTFESLLKKAGPQLDDGTKKTLEGLAETLRKAAKSMDAVDDVKIAKSDITGLIDDKWNEYTGEKNNLLNMDPDAAAESLTSGQNSAPTSVQMLIRTQEIKTDNSAAAEAEAAAAEAAKGTFMSRLLQMFRDLWYDFTHLV